MKRAFICAVACYNVSCFCGICPDDLWMLPYTESDTSRFSGSLAEYPDGHSGREGIRGRAEGYP